jgi:hypothetical protein
VGEYTTTDPSTFPGGAMGHVLEGMEEAVHRESEKPDNNFFNGSMQVRIEQWQPDLKKLTTTVLWEEVPEGSTSGELEERTFLKEFYFHQDSNYTLLE